MSTILDSLKKSSNQRSENDGSSMDNFNFGKSKKASNSFSKIIIVLFIALLLAASFWVYQNYIASDSSDTEVKEVITQKKTNSRQNAKPSHQTNKKEKPDSEIIKAQIKMLKEHKEAEKEKRQARLDDLNRNESSFVKTSDEIDDEKKSPRSLVKTNKYKMDEARENTKPVKPVAIKQQKNETQLAQTSVQKQQYPLLYQLPFAIRKEIPELKLNIHVFDELPENRMAIINGVRFAINDSIDDQILLKDILADGILLDFNGTEFFITN